MSVIAHSTTAEKVVIALNSFWSTVDYVTFFSTAPVAQFFFGSYSLELLQALLSSLRVVQDQLDTIKVILLHEVLSYKISLYS